jgi:hypothetical protein
MVHKGMSAAGRSAGESCGNRSRARGYGVRQRFATGTILLAAFLAAAMLAASPAFAGQTFKFSQKGKGADGLWTTCYEPPAAGVSCTDTYVTASEYFVKADGSTFGGAGIFVDQYTYHFDRRGNFIFDSETYGYGDATFAADSKLLSATVGATIPITICTATRRSYTCDDGGTADVNASWTGTGELYKYSGNFHFKSDEFSDTYHFRGSSREAIGSASIDGADAGDRVYGYIFSSTERDTTICHIC